MSLEIRATIVCDHDACHSELEVQLTDTVTGVENSWDDRDVSRQLDVAGWSKEEDRHYCDLHEEDE